MIPKSRNEFIISRAGALLSIIVGNKPEIKAGDEKELVSIAIDLALELEKQLSANELNLGDDE